MDCQVYAVSTPLAPGPPAPPELRVLVAKWTETFALVRPFGY
jgi:hypothetical protein